MVRNVRHLMAVHTMTEAGSQFFTNHIGHFILVTGLLVGAGAVIGGRWADALLMRFTDVCMRSRSYSSSFS